MADKVMCPGQDTRYWKADDIFDVKCSNCGKILEFFKDDASRKCSACGTRVKNPKLSIGCAQWCEHARECLGYDPNAETIEERPAVDESILEKIMEEIKKIKGKDSNEYLAAIKNLKEAKQLLKGSGANPQIVISASLLMDVDKYNNQDKKSKRSFPEAMRILKEAGLDNNAIESICEIIENIRFGPGNSSEEYKLLENIFQKTEIPVH